MLTEVGFEPADTQFCEPVIAMTTMAAIYAVSTTASTTIAESATKKTIRELSSLGPMYVWLYQHYQPSL